MRTFGLTLVKDEVDIIEQAMRSALRWCDRIAVVDNGSEDGTYALLEGLARAHPQRLHLCGIIDEPFDDSLRRYAFEALRSEAERGDWWCRLDADEFYPVDPRPLLRSVPSYEHVVWGIQVQYYYTDRDYARWVRGEETVADRRRPIQERRRYYRADASEERFVRHRPGLTWKKGQAWPAHLGPVATPRIPVQHFKYRDPVQIRRRLAARQQAYEQGHHNWGDNDPERWTERIVDAADLHYDAHDGYFVIDDALLPSHRTRPSRRLVQRVCHGVGLWP
jgi:hypothetical protein